MIVTAVVVAVYICLSIVFPAHVERRPFCGGLRLQPLPAGATRDLERFRGLFVMTDQETVDYFCIIVFLSSSLLFSVSVLYLVVGHTDLIHSFICWFFVMTAVLSLMFLYLSQLISMTD